MRKIKNGDTVSVISGEHKGERGQVTQVHLRKRRVVVQGVNLVKVHEKRSRQRDGGIIEREAPLAIANVALFCSRCNAAVRVGITTREDGSQTRFCKRCNEIIE